MGNNPVNGVDPDGEFLFFKNRKSANRAASNTNSIFKDKFGIENAVSVFMQENMEVSYYASWWDKLWGIKSTKVETRYYIKPNGEWNLSGLDKGNKFIANSFLDILVSKTHILAEIVPPNTPGYGRLSVGQMTGFTKGPRHVLVPENIPDYNSKARNFNVGSQLLHELLWHVSPAGATLLKAGKNSNWLYNRTGGRRGNPHGVGTKQNNVLPKRKY
jgi:hypothetical protein